MSFRLPDAAPPDLVRDLGRACLSDGYDGMPGPTETVIDHKLLHLRRDVDESGFLVAPWEVHGVGRVMASSATLVERAKPYRLGLELARGKVHQLRNQAADWLAAGLHVSPTLSELVRQAGLAFGRAAAGQDGVDGERLAKVALEAGFEAAKKLTRLCVDQLFQVRHLRSPRLDSTLGVRLNALPGSAESAVLGAFNAGGVPLNWKQCEPQESQYKWDAADAALAWAEANGLKAAAGPLIDFSPEGLPAWLWLWEGDFPSISSFMCDYVETAVGRYKGRIRRWHLTAAANCSSVLKLSEDELLSLTARLAEAAWQVDPELEVIVGLAQPWGEYLGRDEYTYSPLIFADTLLRAGLKLAALEIEWVMGVLPRGTYCRDLLDGSRLLDLYAALGTPIEVTLGYPSAKGPDKLADSAQAVSGGHRRGGNTPEAQAMWAHDFASLALCKPFTRGVTWCHLSDAAGHTFPHCGILDAAGQPKPVAEKLRLLREKHLR